MIKRLFKIALPFLGICILPSFFGLYKAHSQTMSLEACIKYAQANHVNMKNAAADLAAARAKVKETVSIGLPQINGEISYNNNFAIQTQFLPDFISPAVYGVLFSEQLLPSRELGQPNVLPAQFGIKHTGMAVASVNQLIFDGSYFVGLQASRTYVALTQKRNDQTWVETLEKVKKAYYSVLINKERLVLLNASLARLDSSLFELKAMFQQGMIEKLDVDRLQVSRNNLANEQEKVRQYNELALQLLKFQMGMPITENLIVDGDFNNLKPNLQLLANQEPSFQKRPDYQLLQTQKTANELLQKNVKAGYLPSIRAQLNYGYNGGATTGKEVFNFRDRWFEFGSIGLSMRIPIFDGFMKQHQNQQARLEVIKTENLLKHYENAIRLEANQAQIGHNTAVKSFMLAQETLELAQKVLNTTKIKYKEGVGTNLEVTAAETDFKEAQTAYFSAIYDLMVAEIDLQKANGELK